MPRESHAEAGEGQRATEVVRTLWALYSSWKTILVNILFFAVYYAVFYETIVRSNSGFFLLTVPYYLFFLLVLTSSVLAATALRYLLLSRRRRVIEGLAQSPIGVAIGALVASCACSLPLLAPAMYFIGLNAIEVSGVISFLASYQQLIIEVIVILDVVATYYYLRLMSRAGLPPMRS